MYCYSFVLVNREIQESLDNYKRSICVSFSACLGNGVASPLHWPTPAELVLFNNTAYEELRKGPNIHYLYPVLETQNCFLWFFERIYVWSKVLMNWFYGHQSQSIIRSNVFYDVDVMFFLSSCVFRWKMSCSHQKILIAMAFLYNLLKLSCPWNL